MKPYEQGLKNDDGGWGNAVASTSCNYIEFWIKDGIIYYNKFFIGINYDGSASMQFMPTTQVILQESVWQIINS